MIRAETPQEPAVDYRDLYEVVRRRYDRERKTRFQAEEIAERGLREIHERERHAILLEAVARHANGSSGQSEALRSALYEICRFKNWACGFVYLPDEGGQLVLSADFLILAEGLEQFLTARQLRKYPTMQSLPGRVARSMQPAWVPDVTIDENFYRRETAAACGLRAGIAFPVLVDSEVAAVIELFAREALEADSVFLGVLEAIGTQLGRVIERERTQNRLMHEATHDQLTGLPNRTLLMRRLEQLVARSQRNGEASYAVLFVDLDRFKLVNDSLGHHAGDLLLEEIATRFKKCLARWGRPTLLSRLGGDEFVVVMENAPTAEEPRALAERLLNKLARPIDIEGQPLYASASIGVARGNSDYSTAGDILRDADLAMYRAKKSGRGRVSLFEKQLHIEALSRLELESALRSALRHGEFTTHYQPIVELGSNRLVGFEALARWQKPCGLLVPPSGFIDVAEEMGLIVFIGEQILRQACATAARWHARLAVEDRFRVSVNISVRQLQEPLFIRSVTRIMRETGATPEMICFELTENVAIADMVQSRAVLLKLRKLGFGISIDDFGVGHSSLGYLRQLPFDTIKIDKSFVQPIVRNEECAHIVRTVLELARNLNAKVVAEGVETTDQIVALTRLHCDFVQGFCVSRPLEEHAAWDWIASHLGGAPRIWDPRRGMRMAPAALRR